MNLVIDIGNSRIKTAVFHQQKMIDHRIIDRGDFVSLLKQIHANFPAITHTMVSHVGKIESDWEKFLQENFNLITFSTNTAVPFKNSYKTPQTLGLDRMALIAAALQQFPKKNVLIIDAGTCITYDLLTRRGEYLGGAISPGVRMRFNALHTFTNRLPLIEETHETPLIGVGTTESIQSGVIGGASMEIDGFIDVYRKKYRNLTVILTGGDSLLLSKTIKNGIFASANFLLEGLNAILEYNKTP